MGLWDRLKSAVRRTPEPVLARLDEKATSPSTGIGQRQRGRVVTTLPIYLQLQRVAGPLTPADVSQILRQADIGYMWRYVDLLNEMRQKDGHFQSVLQTRELALAGLEWQILPFKPQASKNAKLRDRKAAEFCSEALRQCTGVIVDGKPLAGLASMISHLIGGHLPGYAVSETVFKKEGSSIICAGFDNVSPRRFVHDIEAGVLRWCDVTAGMAYPGINLREEYPGRFIQFEPRVNGDVATREGLGRALLWAALFRNWDLRDWLELAELAWKPWRTGVYKKLGTEQRDIDGLEKILDDMTSSGVAVYPDTAQVAIHWPDNGGKGTSAHKELYDAMGAEMSKAVIGQTLTTEQGTKGSQALGRVHDSVRHDILVADARAVAAVIKRDLLTPLVRMNFGDEVVVPDFKFITEEPEDIVDVSTAIKNLSGIGSPGVPIPVKHIYDVIGIPEPEPGDACVGGAAQVFNGFGKKPDDEVADAAAEAAKPAAEDEEADAGNSSKSRFDRIREAARRTALKAA